jgi:hypothetical protein
VNASEGRRGHADERLELADEVRLIRIAGLERDTGPRLRRAEGPQRHPALKSKDAGQRPGTDADSLVEEAQEMS